MHTSHTNDQFRALKTAVILVLLGRTPVDTRLEQVTRVNPKFWPGLGTATLTKFIFNLTALFMSTY